MPEQTKHFISTSDIVGFRFECKARKAVLVLPPPNENFRPGTLERCPACGEPWVALGTGYEQQFKNLSKQLQTLNSFLAGFEFSMEITPLKSEQAKAA
jgi:hypothetical protein